MASKTRSNQRKIKAKQAPELGIFNIPNFDDTEGSEDGSDIDESGLESELEAILSGKAPVRKAARSKPKETPVLDIERMAAECLKDDDAADDENLSADEDLLSELETLTIEEETVEEEEPPKPPAVENSQAVLDERLKMYEEALKVTSDASKKRRYERAVKTLKNLKKSGAQFNIDEIPPIVKIPTNTSNPSNYEKTNQSVSIDSAEKLVPLPVQNESADKSLTPAISESEDMKLLTNRRNEYKLAALNAKRQGNKDLAFSFLKTLRILDGLIAAMKNNEDVDLSNLPGPPDTLSGATSASPVSSPKATTSEEVQPSELEKAALAAANEPEPALFNAPPAPATVLDALDQRLQKYIATKATAEQEGNSSKARRLQRIVKQYECAIKDFQAGKAIDFEELPVPPGFGPIPVDNKTPNTGGIVPKQQATPKQPPKRPIVSPVEQNASVPSKPKVQKQKSMTSVADKQLAFLLERQKLFRQSALLAKKSGDFQQAKEYLRMSKGFDAMIDATKCGLPLDLTSVPTPPQLESDFVIVEYSQCSENDDLSQEGLFDTLENDLKLQIEVALKNKNHFLRLGDVSSGSKFEKLALESKKDLSVIQNLRNKGESAPKFHYETRIFSMVICHPDLGTNDLEVKVIRGIDLPGKPDDLDSYVRIHFPIPTETPQTAKTHTVKDTNNPTFEEDFKFQFNRQSRAQLRQFKRQAIKLEVWSKGGFLRSDTHLGSAQVPLVLLESKCTCHDSFDLLDSRRKAVGGKIEAIVQIREPLLVKQVEEVREKWLIIGS